MIEALAVSSTRPCDSDHSPVDRGSAVGVVEAMRRVGATSVSEIPIEIAEAQDSLERRIRAHLSPRRDRGPRGNTGAPKLARVDVVLTDNRYTMISVRRIPKEQRYEVRLHHMFADADPVITRALAKYIADNDAGASQILGDFIDDNTNHVRGRTRKTPTTVIFTAGETHDLRAIYDDINERYFDGKIEAAITWGQRLGRPRRRNSIKMGSYSVEDRLIRIHRSLDRGFVPRFFVEWIVFHEMLHQVHDIKLVNGRREFHSKEFMAAEARFEHYEISRGWERAHIDALLHY